FYSREASAENEHVLESDGVSGKQIAVFISGFDPSTFAELAGFTDLTFHVTDRFDVQLGGRESQTKQSYSQTTSYFGADAAPGPDQHSEENSFTYLLTPQFKLSPDFMVYARIASGYRPGGPNVNVEMYHLPLTYAADKTHNYEIGVKGDFLDHVLS